MSARGAQRAWLAPARVALLVCAAAWIAACGYGVLRPGELPGGHALRVAAFGNRTAQAELPAWCAQAARDVLVSRGVLAAEGSSSPILEGELLSLRSAPSALGVGGVAALRVEAELDLRVRDGEQGSLLYSERASGGEDYSAGIDVTESEALRRAAVRRLLERLFAESLDRMQMAARNRAPAQGR